MQKKHNLDFCPQCGNKLEGIEDFCPECGNKLVSEQKAPEPKSPPPPPPQPPVEKQEKKIEPANTQNQQVQQQNIQQQPATNKKDKEGGFPWMKVAVIALIVVAVGVGSFFVVTKTNLFSGSSANQSDFQVTTTTKYFVCYSTANINGKVKAVISNIVVATKPDQDMDWAKGLFEKSIKSKLGNEKKHFKKVFAKSFDSMDEATNGSKEMKKDYKGKGYQLKSLRIEY